MKKVYQTTAGKKTIYVVISAISHLETEDNIDNKKFPYSLDIHYIGKEVSGIIYSDKKERDKVVDDLLRLIESNNDYKADANQTLEKELKDYDPMEALR